MTLLRSVPEDFRGLLDGAARSAGLPPAFVEKDYWVTEVLRSVAAPLPSGEGGSLPVTVVFKGGTSLSKAHALIARFSEDVDILLDAPSLGRGARDRVLKSIGARVEVDTGLQARPREKDRGVKRNFEYEFPRSHAAAVLSPRVLLEMGYRGGPHPRRDMEVSSYIAYHAARAHGLGPGDFSEFAPVRVAVLAPERTLVEKLLCLHEGGVRAVGGDPAALVKGVRHYYDVLKLLGDARVMKALAEHPGGVESLARDAVEKGVEVGFHGAPRPSGGFANSAAFDGGAPWMRTVRVSFEETLPQILWETCPAFEDCLEAVRSNRSML